MMGENYWETGIKYRILTFNRSSTYYLNGVNVDQRYFTVHVSGIIKQIRPTISYLRSFTEWMVASDFANTCSQIGRSDRHLSLKMQWQLWLLFILFRKLETDVLSLKDKTFRQNKIIPFEWGLNNVMVFNALLNICLCNYGLIQKARACSPMGRDILQMFLPHTVL